MYIGISSTCQTRHVGMEGLRRRDPGMWPAMKVKKLFSPLWQTGNVEYDICLI